MWVASKLRSIVGCFGVALPVYDDEVIHLLSRFEKSNVVLKTSV